MEIEVHPLRSEHVNDESSFQVLAGESHRSAQHVSIGRSLRYLWDLKD